MAYSYAVCVLVTGTPCEQYKAVAAPYDGSDFDKVES